MDEQKPLQEERPEIDEQLEPPKPIFPYYIEISGKTTEEFLHNLNKAITEGYEPNWTTLPGTALSVFCYCRPDPLDMDVVNTRLTLAQEILVAEAQHDKEVAKFENVKAQLLIKTNWKEVGEDLGVKITNQSQRDAYVKLETSDVQEKVSMTSRRLSYLRKLYNLGKKPDKDPDEDIKKDTPAGAEVEELE